MCSATIFGFRHRVILQAVVFTFLSWMSQAADDAISIGADRQLFIDDRLIDRARTKGVSRELHSPTDVRRVLKAERPSEALGFIFYGSVVDDGGTVKLFHGSYDAEKKKHFSLATSKDGIHFERPDLGLTEYRGNTANNILPVHAVETDERRAHPQGAHPQARQPRRQRAAPGRQRALSRSKERMGDYVRRFKGRLGKAEGRTATAHKLARILYASITRRVGYNEQEAFKQTPATQARGRCKSYRSDK